MVNMFNFIILILDIILVVLGISFIACLVNNDKRTSSMLAMCLGITFGFLANNVVVINKKSIETPLKKSYVEEKKYVLQYNDNYPKCTNETLASNGVASINMNSGNINLYVKGKDGAIKTQIVPLSKTKIYKTDGNQVTLTIKHKSIQYKKYSMIIGYTHNEKKEYKNDKKYILVMPENMIKAIQ